MNYLSSKYSMKLYVSLHFTKAVTLHESSYILEHAMIITLDCSNFPYKIYFPTKTPDH